VVAIVPGEGDGVLPGRCDLDGPGGFAVHRQSGLGLRSFPKLSAGLLAFVVAGRAGAGVAKVLEWIAALVPVCPLDLSIPVPEVLFTRMEVGTVALPTVILQF
jgi:hypothetical protein